jgi:hypothetical protein
MTFPIYFLSPQLCWVSSTLLRHVHVTLSYTQEHCQSLRASLTDKKTLIQIQYNTKAWNHTISILDVNDTVIRYRLPSSTPTRRPKFADRTLLLDVLMCEESHGERALLDMRGAPRREGRGIDCAERRGKSIVLLSAHLSYIIPIATIVTLRLVQNSHQFVQFVSFKTINCSASVAVQ